MKKVVQREVRECDFCHEREDCYEACLGCGKDICWECVQDDKFGVKLQHGVSYSGGGYDAIYCNGCLPALIAGGDPLVVAYRNIRALRAEAEANYKDFERRSKAASELVKRLRDERRTAGAA